MGSMKWMRLQWDRVAGWATILLGSVVLVLGWIGVSGTAFPAEQLPYILSGGIGGIFLLGLGAVLLLSADLRDEWTKLDRIEEELARRTQQEDLASLTAPLADRKDLDHGVDANDKTTAQNAAASRTAQSVSR